MSRYARRANRMIQTSWETVWTVYRMKTGGLNAHHAMLANLVDPTDVVARVTARNGATAIRAVLEQSTRGP